MWKKITPQQKEEFACQVDAIIGALKELPTTMTDIRWMQRSHSRLVKAIMGTAHKCFPRQHGIIILCTTESSPPLRLTLHKAL